MAEVRRKKQVAGNGAYEQYQDAAKDCLRRTLQANSNMHQSLREDDEKVSVAQSSYEQNNNAKLPIGRNPSDSYNC